MHKTNLYLYLLYSLTLSVILLIIYNYGSIIPYYEKNITDVLINEDIPTLKNINVFNDLSISLIVFLFVFLLIDKFTDSYLHFHLKLIWMIKCFASFFLALIYENYSGLDQITYFNIVINDPGYTFFFGQVGKLFDLNNPTVNFLFPIKLINFIFNDSWFMQKLFQNLLFLLSIIFFVKLIIKINTDFKNNIFIVYLVGFLPSFFIFSSFITKDMIIIFMLSLIFYSLNVLDDTFKYKLKNFFILIFALTYIYLLRWWIAFAFVIPFVVTIFIKFSKKITKNNHYLLLILAFISTIFLFYFSNFFAENSLFIFTEIFERIKVEHSYPRESYDTLFINVGEKFELLYLYPLALFKTVFNPFIFDIHNPRLLLFSLENFILVILLILSLRNFQSNFNYKIFFIISLFLIICHIYIPIGYLNSGTTARYCLQAKFPLLIYIVLMNPRIFVYCDEKLKNLFSSKIANNKINN